MKPYLPIFFGLAALFTIFLPSFGLDHTMSPSPAPHCFWEWEIGMDCLRVVSVAYLCYIVGMDLSLRSHIFSLPFIVTHKGIIMKRTSCPLSHPLLPHNLCCYSRYYSRADFYLLWYWWPFIVSLYWLMISTHAFRVISYTIRCLKMGNTEMCLSQVCSCKQNLETE